MAWPGNNFNSFWEGLYGPPRGAGVDHAPPPPPPPPHPHRPHHPHHPHPRGGPFGGPDAWNRWSQRRGWEDFMPMGPPPPFPPGEGPWGRHGHGPHRRHPHGRDGRHDVSGDEEEAFPPEYISDDEVAAATVAAEEAEKKDGGKDGDKDGDKGGDKDGSPDTMMHEDNAEDPPEEVPSAGEDRRRKHGGKFRGRRGCGGREGFGHRRRGHGGPRGFHHHGPPLPFPPFFGGMFGGPRRPGPHGPHHEHQHGHPPPFPPPPSFDFLFEPPHSGPHGHPPPPPPPPPHGGPHGHPRGPHPPPPPPPPGYESDAPFDFRGMMAALADQPYAQQIRDFIERTQSATGPNHNNNNNAREGETSESDDSDEMTESVTPPLDLFDQPGQWILHIAVPGAKKEDVGVNWDADRSVLSVSGVVYRPGDEEFLKSLISGERSVGLFSREVRLPPLGAVEADAKEEVDSGGIGARMEDGVLIVTVPKVEKDWTEIKRVQID